LCEIPDLIDSVPHGQLQVSLSSAGRQIDLNFDQVPFWGCEINGVGDVGGVGGTCGQERGKRCDLRGATDGMKA
jgi:hypothetical protein